ncbi:isoprenylcysteine carboxylmethyltransferase family protein [Fodinibius sp. Rm-B-1B1-1]|uniref:methyltransferase family protein n=1 Tax=Fodinibius alkaliphilus TaxID=3140241 RepID=UPI00315A0BF9
MEKASAGDNNLKQAQVVLFPPLVGLTLAVTSIFLHIFFPLNITSATIVIIAGIIILGSGIVLQVICLQVFKKAKTTPLFQKPTTNILESGPYARSRNPIYIAVFLQFIGLSFLINTWWLIAALPILYVYLRYGVIAREEQYLEQKFGEEYRRYRSNVPRWF